MAYDNNMTGAVYKNDRQREGTKDPDRTGSCEIDGIQYWISGWLKTSKSGDKFLSLSFKRKDKQPAQQPQQKTPPTQPARKPAPPVDPDLDAPEDDSF